MITAEYQASPDAESMAVTTTFAGEIDTAYTAAMGRSLLDALVLRPLAHLRLRS